MTKKTLKILFIYISYKNYFKNLMGQPRPLFFGTTILQKNDLVQRDSNSFRQSRRHADHLTQGMNHHHRHTSLLGNINF